MPGGAPSLHTICIFNTIGEPLEDENFDYQHRLGLLVFAPRHEYGPYAQAAINYTCMSNTAPAFNYTLITKSSLSIKFLIESAAFSLTPRGFGAHPAARFFLKPARPLAFSIWLIIGLRPVFVALCNATLYH